MIELKLEATGVFDENEISDELQRVNCEIVKMIRVNHFNGQEILLYLLTFSGGVFISEMVKVFTKIVEKDSAKSVKVNGIEIKGYSFAQTEKLLKTLLRDEKGDSDGDK